MYKVCLIGHKQANLVNIKFKLSQNDFPISQYVKISFINLHV